MTGPAPSLPHVRFTRRTLANGLRVIIAPDHIAPVVAVNLWYDVGSRHEVPGKTGFAHLFEHFMFQGSRNVSKAEHMGLIQAAGGTNNATTFFDRTNYFETLPSHQLELALWLEADRMATLLDALSQENLDNQRDVVKNEKRQSYDNRPYGSVYEKLMGALYPAGHPYHHTPIGSMEDLDAASVDDVIGFFRTWYAPNNCVLTIAGDVDEAAAFAAVERWFGPIPANPALRRAPLPADPGRLGGETRLVIEDRVPLSRVHVAWRMPAYGTDAHDALEVATQILVGGRGSRLYRRLVRDERIAQDVAAFTLPLVGNTAVLAAWATALPEADLATVERVLLEEVARLRDEPVTDDELARARALIESSELGALSRMEEVADRLSMFETYFDRAELINEQLSRALAVDARAIMDAARAAILDDDRVVITYVPADTTAEAA